MRFYSMSYWIGTIQSKKNESGQDALTRKSAASFRQKTRDKKHTRMYAFYRVSKWEIPFGSAGSRSKEGGIGRDKTCPDLKTCKGKGYFLPLKETSAWGGFFVCGCKRFLLLNIYIAPF